MNYLILAVDGGVDELPISEVDGGVDELPAIGSRWRC